MKRKKVSKATRLSFNNLLKVIQVVCGYCGTKLHDHNKTLDHVIPLSKGGSNTRSNLIPCCAVCNSNKQNYLKIPKYRTPGFYVDFIPAFYNQHGNGD